MPNSDDDIIDISEHNMPDEDKDNEELKKSITINMIEDEITELRAEVQLFFKNNKGKHKFIFNKLLEEYKKEWKIKYKNIYIKSPKLFQGLADNILDPGILHIMIQKLKDMENNKISNKAGTEEVGELLFNRYVKPNLDKYPKKK